ncbi:MAG TPA: hypothetical protein VK932_18670 [Kofleriaceae bacterium]|nr:hypothetical protein [Kofleriaceae bacterium]
MKLKSVRALRAPRTEAPRLVRPRAIDATMEPDPGPGPEAVFDRVTGPYALRRGYDEET